jgi:hypothetical protein
VVVVRGGVGGGEGGEGGPVRAWNHQDRSLSERTVLAIRCLVILDAVVAAGRHRQ